MNIAQKARVATIAVLATVLLAGCATAEAVPDATPSPSATTDASQPENGEDSFAKATKTAQMSVQVIDVIDPRTFTVGPTDYDREKSGFSGTVTVTIPEESPLVTPAEGECGYDESLAFAQQYFAEKPGDAFLDAGSLGSEMYPIESINAGFAYVAADPNDNSDYAQSSRDAQLTGTGLWATCPGFGE